MRSSDKPSALVTMTYFAEFEAEDKTAERPVASTEE